MVVGGVVEAVAVACWLAFVVADFVGIVAVVGAVAFELVAFALVAIAVVAVALVVDAAVEAAFAALVTWEGCFGMMAVAVADVQVEEVQVQSVCRRLVVGAKVHDCAAAVGSFVVVEAASLVDSEYSVVC